MPHQIPPPTDLHKLYHDYALDSILLLSMPQNVQWPDPTNYALDKSLTIEMPGGDGTQWCEKAKVTIRRLTDIGDSQAVENIVAELLRL